MTNKMKYLWCLFGLLSCGNVKNNDPLISSREKSEPISISSDEVIKTFISEQYSFGFSYPSDWETLTENKVIFAAKTPYDTSDHFCPNLVVTSKPLSETSNLNNYSKIFQLGVEASMEYCEFISVDNEEINGIEAIIMDYKFVSNNLALGGTTAIYQIKENIIQFSFVAPNENGRYAHYRKLFVPVMMSVHTPR